MIKRKSTAFHNDVLNDFSPFDDQGDEVGVGQLVGEMFPERRPDQDQIPHLALLDRAMGVGHVQRCRSVDSCCDQSFG